ncbi:hypothetical protein EC919_101274 [Pseudomonas graminis]|uniref:hypothetical protein n=1 Tax=Pseudomonas graminis TaxID=158627 RepID=UPI00105ECAAD|nr:hypothetical protein [Pseudomonas graminis]TDV58228.1 hypothetical protein EC919_101274 [Pseudomonas graminis]
MFPYIASYLLFAAILALVDHLADKPLFIRTHLKHFPWKLNYSFRWWGVQEYWAAVTVISMCALVFLLFWHCVGGAIHRDADQLLYLPIALGSTVIAARHFRLVEKFRASGWWITLLVALPTLCLGIYASAHADSYILNVTRVDPAKFPVAQKALTSLILVTLWVLIGVVSLSVVVVLVSIILAARTPTFIGLVMRDRVKLMAWEKHALGTEEKRQRVMLAIIFAGSTLTATIAMNFLEYIARHVEGALQETLVFSSFHLHPRDCAIPGWTRDAWVALIDDSHAVLAEHTANGYLFRTVTCEMQTTSALKRGVMDRLKRDDYR